MTWPAKITFLFRITAHEETHFIRDANLNGEAQSPQGHQGTTNNPREFQRAAVLWRANADVLDRGRPKSSNSTP